MAKFEKGNPGKPKGALNTFTKTVKDVFTDVFNELQQDPKAKLSVWGKENPEEFYKLCSKLIPTAMDVKLDNNIITVIAPGNK